MLSSSVSLHNFCTRFVRNTMARFSSSVTVWTSGFVRPPYTAVQAVLEILANPRGERFGGVGVTLASHANGMLKPVLFSSIKHYDTDCMSTTQAKEPTVLDQYYSSVIDRLLTLRMTGNFFCLSCQVTKLLQNL